MTGIVKDLAMMDTERPTELVGVLQLPILPESVHLVREFVGLVLDGWNAGGAIENAQLCVSELATNVYSHAGGTVMHVQVKRQPERRIRVEVYDGSTEPPCVRADTIMRDSGNGLFLVEAVSDDWGYRLTGDGKVVWFEIS
jgi:anti-sigma regulatory factor (Ser/Thr protein kinase)